MPALADGAKRGEVQGSFSHDRWVPRRISPGRRPVPGGVLLLGPSAAPRRGTVRRSVVVTSNLVFSEWGRIFKNPMTTAAAVDRLVHHGTILDFSRMRTYREPEGSGDNYSADDNYNPGDNYKRVAQATADAGVVVAAPSVSDPTKPMTPGDKRRDRIRPRNWPRRAVSTSRHQAR